MRFSLIVALLAGIAIDSLVVADSDGSNNDGGVDAINEGFRRRRQRGLRESSHHTPRALQSDSTSSCNECRDGSAATSRPSNFDTREEIFDQLDPSEYKSVIDFVTSDEINIADKTKEGISSADQALNRNYVVFVQLFPPPKAEAIAYLDRLTDTPPERYAVVTVNRGRQRPRDMMQYKIGPLVNGNVRSQNPVIEELLDDNEIPWAMRGNYHSVTGLLDEAIHKHAYELRELFKATTNGYCIGGDECNGDDKMRFIQYANLATTPTKRVSSVHFILRDSKKEFGPSCLLPVPISFHVVEDPDKDPSEWEANNFEYCYQGPYESATALLDAIYAGEVQPCGVPSRNLEWTSVDPVEPLRPDATIKEPISFHSSGKRYTIDSATSDRRILKDESREEDGDAAVEENNTNHNNGRLRFTDFVSSTNKSFESNENKSRNRNLRTVRGGGGDGTGHRVSWLGWSFHVSSDQMHGMVLRNLSFKGERLAYELSFQEFFASYSSMGSPGQTVYFDTNWEVGKYSPLELGLDCPEDATLLPIIQHDGDRAEISENLMCIFEQPYGEPMWRHEFKKQNSRIGGIPRTALQIRVVSVLGNYDYIPTLTLMADGVMEVKVEMGGYLQAGFSVGSSENNLEVPWFGTRLRDRMAGLLHDHIVGVKLDLDVGGLSNTLKAGKIKYGTYEEATGGKHPAPGYHSYNGVKYMNWTTIDSERGISHTDYDSIVVESPTRNQWGAHRSYEIVFEHSIPRQLFPEDHPLAAATAWQYSNVAITRQKDSERYCSFPSNYQVGRAIPSYDLREFQRDQEKVVEEDLVFWIMFGLQHYPKAEDVPLVSNFGSGFLLKPRNMYDRAAFEDLPDNRNNDHPACIAPSRM